MNAKKYGVLAAAFLLTACAPTPRPAEEAPLNKVVPLEKRKAETATVSSWEINGAMAAKNKAKSWSASMNWVQHGPNSYQIRLIGPLGGGTVLINKTGKTISFQDGAKKVSSTNADELLMQQTGIRLPVNNLYYWVRGLPAPGGVQAEKHDEYNHLTQLQQAGYVIDFTQYTSVKGIDLPSTIRLVGNGVMVKVIIKHWSV
ncbi:lipoprotein insertase outer membrane protein LolB [Legionella sp. km772]|uniref:lipoprotein insertase outer membrane protein LolB n=1 Tax=Legionella sp. km772 TaxID=2498111 RepID=UPI000F8D6B22|nr:lipoprotein insertase outer membrane protein LolB [Legionella sp. km772]RUR13014.1 outer membrane lipoprotein LolB [Legionella sp. km772]